MGDLRQRYLEMRSQHVELVREIASRDPSMAESAAKVLGLKWPLEAQEEIGKPPVHLGNQPAGDSQ